jgi:hypothetical protein
MKTKQIDRNPPATVREEEGRHPEPATYEPPRILRKRAVDRVTLFSDDVGGGGLFGGE